MTKQSTHQPKIGLALGSGSARGLAHIGVIRALKDAGIHIDCVAGTSFGAIIGAVYASGKLDNLQAAYIAMDWKNIAYFFDVVFPKSGIIDGKKVADFMREYVRSERIEDLLIPFKAVATELDSGEEVVLGTGDVIDAVRASISIPGMFTPARRNGRVLVDGGLVNPVPVNVVRAMGADIVIAVDVNHDIVAGNAPKISTKPADEDTFIQTLTRLGEARYLAIGALAFNENRYDGHTLPGAFSQVERILGHVPKICLGDRGYRGKSKINHTRIHIPKPPRKNASKVMQAEMRKRFQRRAAIEPMIGHLKSDHRLNRNFLKGFAGDQINLLMAAAAFNFKKWMRDVYFWLVTIRQLFCWIISPAEQWQHSH